MGQRNERRGRTEGDERSRGETGMGRWLLTYADMITLLMMLFTVLYASSVLNLKKFEELAHSLGLGFRAGPSSAMMDRTSLLPDVRTGAEAVPNQQARGGRALSGVYEKARSMFQPEIGKKKIRLIQEQRGLVVQIGADFFFAPGSAEIGEDAQRVLFTISSLLAEIPNKVQIEGHTDNLPIEEGSAIARRYPSNWELSGQRAINVLKSLASLGVEEERLSAVARGETRPMVSNDTPEGRAYNRRVEIVILP